MKHIHDLLQHSASESFFAKFKKFCDSIANKIHFNNDFNYILAELDKLKSNNQQLEQMLKEVKNIFSKKANFRKTNSIIFENFELNKDNFKDKLNTEIKVKFMLIYDNTEIELIYYPIFLFLNGKILYSCFLKAYLNDITSDCSIKSKFNNKKDIIEIYEKNCGFLLDYSLIEIMKMVTKDEERS